MHIGIEWLLAATAVGLLEAVIGATKDCKVYRIPGHSSPLKFESFSHRSFWRSPILVVSLTWFLAYAFQSSSPMLVVLGAFTVERMIIELWKGTLRRQSQAGLYLEDPIAYRSTIAASKSIGASYGIGIGILTGILVVITIYVETINPIRDGTRWVWIVIGLGLISGLIVAMFGAWKDTLWESFSFLKFLRSPGFLIGGTVIMGLISTHSNVMLICAGGFAIERLVIESYKVWRSVRYEQFPSKFGAPHRDGKWLTRRLLLIN